MPIAEYTGCVFDNKVEPDLYGKSDYQLDLVMIEGVKYLLLGLFNEQHIFRSFQNTWLWMHFQKEILVVLSITRVWPIFIKFVYIHPFQVKTESLLFLEQF